MIQLQNLEQFKSIITKDKRIRGGIPVFKGTRIPIYYVLEDLSLGWEVKDIQKVSPELKKEHLQSFFASLADKFKPNGKKKTKTSRELSSR